MEDFSIQRESNGTRGRYATVVDGHEAELTFAMKSEGCKIVADHTGVPEAIGGRGVGTALVLRMVEDAKRDGCKITPLCPFVNAQYARHPEWSDVME